MSENNGSLEYRNADGTFTNGHPGFKQPGTSNKVTSDRKAKLLAVCQAIENNHLDKDLEALEPAERVRLWIQINEFLVPKLSRVQAEFTIPEDIEEIVSMTPEERRKEIAKLRELVAKNGEGKDY